MYDRHNPDRLGDVRVCDMEVIGNIYEHPETHFKHAKKIINSWPSWKQELAGVKREP
jgi:hypothetical protein